MIDLPISGILIPTLVDTGSSTSLLDFEIYCDICKRLQHPYLKPTVSEVRGLGDGQLEVVGSADIQVSTIGIVPFLIIKKLPHNAILGSDNLLKGKANFDFSTDTLFWHNQTFSLYSCPDSIKVNELSSIPYTQNINLNKLLQNYADIIDTPGKILKPCNIVSCKIPTDSRPIRQRAYRAPLSKRKIISDQIDDMLNQGIIRPSSSPWASPITLVPKKGGELRFCVDYRKLNSVTIKDSYPLPLIQDIFDQLSGAKLFSTLDLKSAYWQIPVSEKDIHKTAFICHRGLFEFLRMPFGLCNAPATLQRALESILHDLIGVACFIYLDDIVVFGQNEVEHLHNLELIFERFRKHKLTIKPSKCKFLQPSVQLLGYIISEKGIAPNPSKVEAIKLMPSPTKLTELRTFLGMSGYYRQVIPNYATLAYPLVSLTKKNVPWNWSVECENAFKEIKNHLTSDSVLAFPQTDKPYKLYCDASNYAVGAVLTQDDDQGVEKVLHYLSHTLDQTQQNWATIEKEAYAIVYALQKLRPYLWGSTFEIITDHKPLKSLFANEIANSKIQRWAVQISEFGAPIRYRCGKDNARADLMSRLKIPDKLSVLSIEWEFPLEFDNIKKDDLISEQEQCFTKLFENVSPDSSYGLINDILVSKKRPSLEHARHPRVVLPPKWRKQVVLNRHIQAGHAAYARTLYHVQQNYVWPGMCHDIKVILGKCGTCKLFSEKIANVHMRPMPKSFYPHQIVSMDIVGPMPRSRHNHNFLLTFICHLTGWADVFPLTNKSGSTVAKILEQKFLPQYGLPEVIISDNGTEFCNSDVADILKKYGIKHQRSTIYHPQSNGRIERYHRSLKSILKKFIISSGSSWIDQIGPALMAYRNRLNSSVGISPFEALYGRKCRLPYQNSKSPLLGNSNADRQQTLFQNWDLARQNQQTSHQINTRYVNRKSESDSLKVGQNVMLRRPGLLSSLDPKWTPHWIVVRASHPTYWLRHLPTGSEKTVHRSRIQEVAQDTEWPDIFDDNVHNKNDVLHNNNTLPLVSNDTKTTQNDTQPVNKLASTAIAQLPDQQPPLRMVIGREPGPSGRILRSTPYIIKSSTVRED